MNTDLGKLMACGCASNGYMVVGDDQVPCCVSCGCADEAFVSPDLSGRVAVCSSCKREHESALTLPFFAYRDNAEKDLYYCGCRGWD